ncbi:MAG: hypothetical protein ACPGVG_17445 [Mycobacterium sp.]
MSIDNPDLRREIYYVVSALDAVAGSLARAKPPEPVRNPTCQP